ncbi:TRAPP trafficking subunit Trs65-domain-containing protein [Xylaria intraflava]|nr:TRAPP trafficking subunit Trs65-domain-containing protein [Xylaria intraflava]
MGDQLPPTESESQPDPIDFVANSSLEYFIPGATDFATDQFFGDGGLPFGQLLDSIERRESLFFDESVHVVLILRIPYDEDAALQATLKSLVISLDVQIVSESIADRDGSPASEVIYAGTIDGSREPVTLIHQSTPSSDANNDGDHGGYTYAIWDKFVFLSRPRIRLQRPSAVFAATANSRSATGPLSNGPQDGYMQSGIASSLNLLESFSSDPALNGIKPRLSALRVSRVSPFTQRTDDLVRPVKSFPTFSLRIYPAVHSRIRFTHLNSASATTAVIAMLEVDFTPFFNCEIMLDKIALTIPDAVVEDLTDEAGLRLPLSCVSHDHITFIYRIVPIDTDVPAKNLLRDLSIAISSTALVGPRIKPQLRMAWIAAIDFTVPMNPGYGTTIQPIQRTHRSSHLSNGGESVTLTAPSVARPDSLPSLEASTTQIETTVQELGLTVTFTAPSPAHKIFVGDTFSWDVFFVNQSPSQSAAARKLAMVVISTRRRHESRVTRTLSILQAPEGPDRRSTSTPHRSRDVAEAILDDNVVHAMQTSGIVDNAQLVCLSPDLRVGPLAPGACQSVELKFLALKEGIVGVDAVRIIDLVSNEHVDIRQFPSIIVENKPTMP